MYFSFLENVQFVLAIIYFTVFQYVSHVIAQGNYHGSETKCYERQNYSP